MLCHQLGATRPHPVAFPELEAENLAAMGLARLAYALSFPPSAEQLLLMGCSCVDDGFSN